MVFGNLSTGYWLGAAAAAGLHWIELGRTTLTGTSDTIDVNPAEVGWTSQTPTVVYPSGSDGRFNFTAEAGDAANDSSSYDLGSGNVSDTQWVLRWEYVRVSGGGSGNGTNHFFGLAATDSTSTSATSDDLIGMCWGEPQNSGQSLMGILALDGAAPSSTGTFPQSSARATVDLTASTTYYMELKRTSADEATFTIRTGSHSGSALSGFPVTDSGEVDSGLSSLRYLKFLNRGGDGNRSGSMVGYIDNIQFWNATNTTTGTPTKEFTFTPLTAKPYMMVLGHGINSGAVRHCLRFNGDTGSNYAWRNSANGSADGSGETSNARIVIGSQTTSAQDDFSQSFITANGEQEPLTISHVVKNSGTGAGNAPDRSECAGKRGNTENVTSLQLFNSESGDFDTGSECVVLGYDPDDTEGTSVWEELKGVSVGSDSATISTGTISAKKYLWIQVYLTATAHDFNLQFNGDTGSNYTKRRSENGGSDSTNTSQDRMTLGSYNSSADDFYNIFIINKSDKEKLAIIENSNRNTAGAGNAPNRSEYVAKWINTSAQITSIVALQQSGGSGNFGTGSYMKVWGFD